MILATVFVFASVIIWMLWNNLNAPVGTSETEKSVVIAKGSSGIKIGQKLKKDGLIRSELFFRIYIRFRGVADKIPPGSYEIAGNLKTSEVVNVLLSGPKDVWVLIPEGLRREEISEIVSEGLGKKGLEKETFMEEFLVESTNLEGSLFPDTYLFPVEISAKNAVLKMNQTFFSKTTKILSGLKDGKTKSGLSFDEVIVLASIIEREESRDSQRPLVAGILTNRLEIGMALQADATVQYALANVKCKSKSQKCDWWPVVVKSDLDIESPFNTYKINGLPPLPISNPGISSIEAAANPKTSDYLYYIHDADGQIHPATTFEEHASNISRYLR